MRNETIDAGVAETGDGARQAQQHEDSGPGGSDLEGKWRALTPEQRALASRHIGLVGVHLRSRVRTPREPMRHREYEDLFQEGCVALIRAAARYDPGKDGEFAAYALARIRGGVHTALHERFSIIRIPARAQARATTRAKASLPPPPHPVQEPFRELSEALAIEVPVDFVHRDDAETIRHTIRRRFERAVHNAMAELRGRRWRRRNPCEIMARIAAERLLISRHAEQTPLRRIAREAGVSSGRASAYEQQLLDTVNRHFSADPQVPVLISLANRDPARFEGVINARRRELLQQAELDAFEDRFASLERRDRAELIYSMIERSAAAIAEVARNLYRLTGTDEESVMPEIG